LNFTNLEPNGNEILVEYLLKYIDILLIKSIKPLQVTGVNQNMKNDKKLERRGNVFV
jgi:hypothetical protein